MVAWLPVHVSAVTESKNVTFGKHNHLATGGRLAKLVKAPV